MFDISTFRGAEGDKPPISVAFSFSKRLKPFIDGQSSIIKEFIWVVRYSPLQKISFLGNIEPIMLYYRPGAKTNGADYSEISRFIEWRDNAMKYMSYPDAQKLMLGSAMLNNLDKSSPEARRQLDRINNMMKFMGYSEALQFLRGEQP